MDFKVVFRDSFLEDLEQIVRSVAQHNQTAALQLGATVIEMGESLSFFPERHPRVRERPSMRRFIAARHFKVFYRVHRDTKLVEILRCWDGRRASDPRV
ncbi:hypothetical protein ASA1KI_42840 [Opitutales bacterium ASA1]|uniref:type II toxin-antitoxin system RelE/ParE family toxin n=1 Tax=Congregicoccus parvus TaxID=3081749 RepID=UPI002B30C3F8|nr:hypothetical protein ASA1KI_42840 [Opitutales bacterium ASA1]